MSVVNRAPRHGQWAGPAVLGVGFRPFFLLAAIDAVLLVPLWLAVLGGHVVMPTTLDPVLWHGHEMLFGFAQAAMAGFLLTAVPNWTGRLPIRGWPLGFLVLVFVAGRIVVTVSTAIGPVVAAVVDLTFPMLLVGALAREIIAGRNWRNLPLLLVFGLFAAANALIHVEALGWADTGRLGLRLGVAVAILLILLIGGRIIPSFTRNWLAQRQLGRLPSSFGVIDKIAILTSAGALGAWVLFPDSIATAPLMAVAAAMNFIRLARWQGHRTWAEPLVWVLHAGYFWIPVGFALMAVAHGTAAIDPSAALHGFTGGAIAVMILAVSTRATLGHTGRELHADRPTAALYVLAVTSAVARLAADFLVAAHVPLLLLAGLTWIGAFGLLLWKYGPMLIAPLVSARHG